MRSLLFVALSGAIALGSVNAAMAQQAAPQHPIPFRQVLQSIHSPASVDEELARLTKDMSLTPTQQKQTRLLLQQHHDKIQALLDKNPSATRQSLGPQIHAISDTTHHQVDALLTKPQKQLELQMQERLRAGQENRHPG
jgi:hypothetical protein